MNTSAYIFEGKTPGEVLRKSWESVNEFGTEIESQRGTTKSIKGVTFIVNEPTSGEDIYPYWDKVSDDWYQENFVRKESNLPPEDISAKDEIIPYKYVWRSRYYDCGYGHVVATVKLLNQLGYHKLEINNETQITELVKKTFRNIHPETLISVISWKGLELINRYLSNIEQLEMELKSFRRDTLLSIINELKVSPNSRRAIIPSFTYEHIDHSGAAGGVPVYQNYQLIIEKDQLISFHLHRALDAKGGAQLDISHDREWGQLASSMLGLPLKKMFIYCNDYWYTISKDKPEEKYGGYNTIKDWLFAMTDGYDPKMEDIEKRLASDIFKKKIALCIEKANKK